MQIFPAQIGPSNPVVDVPTAESPATVSSSSSNDLNFVSLLDSQNSTSQIQSPDDASEAPPNSDDVANIAELDPSKIQQKKQLPFDLRQFMYGNGESPGTITANQPRSDVTVDSELDDINLDQTIQNLVIPNENPGTIAGDSDQTAIESHSSQSQLTIGGNPGKTNSTAGFSDLGGAPHGVEAGAEVSELNTDLSRQGNDADDNQNNSSDFNSGSESNNAQADSNIQSPLNSADKDVLGSVSELNLSSESNGQPSRSTPDVGNTSAIEVSSPATAATAQNVIDGSPGNLASEALGTSAALRNLRGQTPLGTQMSSVSGQVAATLTSRLSPLDKEPIQTLSVELHPAELGYLKIQVEQVGEQISAKIIASEMASAELLTREKDFLLEALDELGGGEANVDISHNSSQQFEDESSANQQHAFDVKGTESTDGDTGKIIGIKPTSSTGINLVA